LEAFTAQQACRFTGCTPHQLRYWDRVNLVRPTVQRTGGRPGRRRLYAFRDLVALRVVRSLLDNGMSVQRGTTCAAPPTWIGTWPRCAW
jgi:DNA-binding transcriptional MerR regulator